MIPAKKYFEIYNIYPGGKKTSQNMRKAIEIRGGI